MKRWLLVLGLVVLSAAVSLTAVYVYDYGEPVASVSQRTPRATRPATTREAAIGSNDTTLLRELPRQAVLLASTHCLELSAVDRSVDFAGVTPAPAVDVTVSATAKWLSVTLSDAEKKPLKTLRVPLAELGGSTPDYVRLAAELEGRIDTEIIPLLAPAVVRPGQAGTADGLPAGVEALLLRPEPQAAFLAARRLHAVVSESGESPQRLAALSRAYANLAEATRHLYSRHSSVFFARALLYAERLRRLQPDLPLSHATRGYVYTLVGLPLEGRAGFEKARRAGELPAWAQAADHLNHFRTRALVDAAARGDDAAPLARYFALLSVEHSGMQSIVMNLGRAALQDNPGAFRVVNILTDNGGVAARQSTTTLTFTSQYNALAALASEEGVPAAIRAAAESLRRPGAGPADIRALWGAMDAQPAGPGEWLSWGTYASISRDALFVAALRRVNFLDASLAVDTADEAAALWPLVQDHRFAPVIAGYDPANPLGGRDAAKAADGFDELDFFRRMPHLVRAEKLLDKARPGRVWLEAYNYGDDHTAYDLAASLWAYRPREADAVPVLSLIKGKTGETLSALSPDHPSAVAELIVNRWPQTRARAAEIERDQSGHPQIAYALARAYRSERRYDDAIRLLETASASSPDPRLYAELAAIYTEQGDTDKWLAVQEKYLQRSEDFGLDHARVNAQIAVGLLQKQRADRALAYAEKAAGSGSSWGLALQALCLNELGRFDEAEALEKQRQARYPGSFAWYFWCQTTGRGDLNGAREAAEEIARRLRQSDRETSKELAVYDVLEGRIDQARAAWEKPRFGPGDALQVALLLVEQGDTEAAVKMADRAIELSHPVGLPPQLAAMAGGVTAADDRPLKAYAAAAEELRRCLADPAAVPERGGPMAVVFAGAPTPERGMIAYAMGRLCELRGKPGDALWWYRAARDCREVFHYAVPLTAAGLRRLGYAYYP